MRLPLIITTIVLLAAPAFLAGQSYRGTVNEGNELYRQKKYDAAREKYERAAAADAERPESYFNSGNTAYRSDDVKSALEQYEKAGMRFRDRERIAQTLYNAGNTFLNAAEKGAENPMLQQAAGDKAEDLRMEGYRQAIEMYKKALKLNPEDEDARYNLTYARKKLEDLQKQQQNKDQNKDQKQQQKQKEQDKQQDQQNKDKNKQEEQQKKDQQDQQQQKQQNQKGENEKDKAKKDQQKQPQPDKDQQMSKQQAEQILRALQREEKDLQKKKRQEQGRRVNVEKDW